MMKKALFQTPEDDLHVRCTLCPNFCLIAPGKRGLCGTRENISGILYALSYGVISSEALDPVEKKPLNHFMPGTVTYSIGSFGCNFFCRHCQNHEISQTAREYLMAGSDMAVIAGRPPFYTELTPEDVIARALLSGAQSISFTYNEPTVSFEFVRDVAVLAAAEGLPVIFVTNGFIAENALNALLPYISAYRLDIKAFDPATYEKITGSGKKIPRKAYETVLHSAVLARSAGCHVEIVTLLIPGVNDDREKLTAGFSELFRLLGENTPVHLTAYHPAYESSAPPTSPELIFDTMTIAKDAGFRFVYPGNIRLPPDAGLSDTACPSCGNILIRRDGYRTDICGISRETTDSDAEGYSGDQNKNKCDCRTGLHDPVCRKCGRSVSAFIRI